MPYFATIKVFFVQKNTWSALSDRNNVGRYVAYRGVIDGSLYNVFWNGTFRRAYMALDIPRWGFYAVYTRLLQSRYTARYAAAYVFLGGVI